MGEGVAEEGDGVVEHEGGFRFERDGQKIKLLGAVVGELRACDSLPWRHVFNVPEAKDTLKTCHHK